MKMTKILSVVLSAAMMLTAAGCSSGDNTKYVAKLGETEVPAGIYLYNMMNGYYEAAGKVADRNKSVLSQKIDDISAKDWIKNKALEGLKVYAAAEQEFSRLGLELSEEDLATVGSTLNTVWERDQKFYEKNGISKNSVELILINSSKMNYIYEAYYGLEGEKSAPEAEVKAYYDENYSRINQILIDKTTKTESGETVPLSGEALLAVKNQANDYFERLNSGEKFEDISVEFDKAKAEAAGEEYKPHEHEEDAFAHDIIVSKTQMYFPEKYLGQVFETEVGKVGLYEEDDFYIVFARKDLHANPEDFEKRKEQLSFTVAGEGFTDDLLELGNTIELNLNQKAISRYSPKDLKLS